MVRILDQIGHNKTTLKIAIPVILAFALFTWMYWRDINTFLLPDSLLFRLYSYTAVFISVSAIILLTLRTADSKHRPENSRLRNNIRLLLGSFWIIDGLLQIQPQMPFGFSHFILYNSLQSLPAVVSAQLNPLIVLWNSHGIIFDALAGSLQIFIGIALFLVRSRTMVSRIAVLSTIWALSIWVLGEGLGGILQPGLSLISGFPGGALIYAFMGMMLMMRRGENMTRKVAYTILGSTLLIGSVVQALPFEGFWVQYGLASIPGMMVTSPQPLVFSTILYLFASLFSYHWILWNALFALIFAILGVLWFTQPRVAGIGTIAMMGLVWLFGQDLGIFGMYGTDLNSALPFLLLALVAVSGSLVPSPEKTDGTKAEEQNPEGLLRTG